MKFSGILVNPRVHQYQNKKIGIKYFLYKYLLYKLISNKYLEKIFSNDILFYNFSINKKFNNKIIFFNEPVNKVNKKSRIKSSIAKGFFNVLVYGAIRNSKSLEELIEITKKIKNYIKINIIVAGKQNIEAKKILNKKNLVKKSVDAILKYSRFIYPAKKLIYFQYKCSLGVYKNTPSGLVVYFIHQLVMKL